MLIELLIEYMQNVNPLLIKGVMFLFATSTASTKEILSSSHSEIVDGVQVILNQVFRQRYAILAFDDHVLVVFNRAVLLFSKIIFSNPLMFPKK